jgi:glycosyltransferase involved in cell wall biosynthesis
MEAGLPVVATDVGDVRGMVSAENRDFIVDACDAALSGALRALVSSASLRARVGQANRARQRTHYTLPRMVEAYGALFERMSTAGRRRPR